MKTVNPKGVLLHAAFFMEGLHEAGYDACIAAWDQGCIEMVDALIDYAPFLATLVQAADNTFPDEGRPGVFDYEVSASFGEWFGKHILEKADVPPEQDARAWLIKETLAFYSQHTSPEVAAQYEVAINQAAAAEAVARK